jgi:hypothetical protein
LYDNVSVTVTPTKMEQGENEIFYSETAMMEEMKISIIYEFRFRSIESGCNLSARILSGSEKELPAELYSFLSENLKISCQNLKVFSENGFQPVQPIEA